MNRGERWLAALVPTAILARVAAVIVLQSHHVPRSTYEHGEIAASLIAGRGFSMHFLGADGPTSQQAPVYPFIVAAAYAVGGVEKPQALLILELGQALLGGLMVLGVFRLATWVSPDRPSVAWWGAAVAAFHPTLVYAATHVQVALLAATLVAWTLVWAARLAETRRSREAVVCGLMLAICALTDPILSLVGLGVLTAIVVTNTGTARRTVWRLGAVVVMSAALGLTPWVIRNAFVHGEFLPIKSTFGYAFWQGNCALSEGTDKVVRPSVENVLSDARQAGDLASYNQTIWKARHTAGYIDDIALTKEERQWLGTLPEPERSRVLLRRAIDEIRRDPPRYVGLCLKRFRSFWLFDETNPRSRVLVYRASHLALTGLALLGLVTAGPGIRRRSIPLLVTVAAISLFHALTIVSARFHIPIEPLMAVWVGVGMTWLAGTIASFTRRRSEMTPGGLEHVGVIGRLG